MLFVKIVSKCASLALFHLCLSHSDSPSDHLSGKSNTQMYWEMIFNKLSQSLY